MSINTETPRSSHSHKHKESERTSSKSSSKKRKRQEDGQDELGDATQGSSTKKHKRSLDSDDTASRSTKKHKQHQKHTQEGEALRESQQSTQSQTSAPRRPPPSPFALQTTSLYLPLSPVGQSSPTNGLCAEHLSPLILTYVPALRGILLSYSNPRISNTQPARAASLSRENDVIFGKSIDEYAFSYVWLTAEFLVLKPISGAEMEGYVNVQNESRLGVLCWNLFNASIERKRLPKDWRWDGPTSKRRKTPPPDADSEDDEDEQDEEQRKAEEAEGGFLDGDGEGVMGRHIKFKIVDWELYQSGRPADASATTSSLVSFEGTMLSDQEENKLKREAMVKEADRLAEVRKAREKRLKAARRQAAATGEAEEDG